MPKVHLLPVLNEGPDPGNGGIHRVLVGQYATLPQFGWEITTNPAEADVIACHVEVPTAYMRLYPEKPFVVHNHGLYWTDGDYPWEQWCYQVNQRGLAAIRMADAVTAVSEWTAQSLRRASMRDVRVVYHGVDLDEWTPVEPGLNGGYVLWNKTRVDPICDPAPLNAAARLLPRVRFVSTFADEAPNVQVVGKVAYEQGKEMVRRAGVYLATTRETFGIGTLEALAAGVPVVGYAFGGQVEIVEHGVDGWLARPGDTDGLAEGIEWALSHREEIAPRARAKAEQFPVARSGEQYARLYDEVVERHRALRAGPKVSVIVPAYNMGAYLDDTLRSVAEQDDPDWECIVVNDASPDPRDHETAQRWTQQDGRFREIVLAQNGYLANARNVGIAAAQGRYVFPLDADDQITPGTLRTLADVLEQNRDLHIAYGNVRFVGEDGTTPIVYAEAHRAGLAPGHSGWPMAFHLEWMLRGPGQLLPYASMFRRQVWELTGGYRIRSRSSEDQDFWLRATSYGFIAQYVTEADTLVYRVRPGSMSSSAGEGWEEHRPWFPWAGPDGDRTLIPAAAPREGIPLQAAPMPALDPAWIAVVIPVGPGHGPYVMDAIDSVDAQTFRYWECIVVNDSGEPLPNLPSWVKVVETWRWTTADTVSKLHRFGGVAAARNAGIRATRAPLFLPLDADDYLQPNALEAMLDDFTTRGPAAIYSDFWEDPHERGKFTVWQTPDYQPETLIRRGIGRAVTALTQRSAWEAVGGYDEDIAWEDWAFALKYAAKGYCERRIALPLFTYRKHTGLRRSANMADFEQSKASIMAMDFGIRPGGELMACSSCPSGRGTTAMSYTPGSAGQGMVSEDAVLVEYTGPLAGETIYRSKVNGQVRYRFGANHPQGYVLKEDAEAFIAMGLFRKVDVPAAVVAVSDGPMLVAAREPVLAGAPAGAEGAGPPTWAGAATGAAPEAPAPAEPPQQPVEPSRALPPMPKAEPSTEAKALADRHTREELNAMAAAEHLAGYETLATKAEVAMVILAKRSIRI